ncbi:MAG: choice-of-anchor D domain-containing protein, partial [Thermoguttaceae bacterium]
MNAPFYHNYSDPVTGTVNPPLPAVEVLSGRTVAVNEAVQSGTAVDFGSTPKGTPVEHTFTVENTGTAALTLDPDSLSLPDGFSVVTPFAASVAPGASTTLVV